MANPSISQRPSISSGQWWVIQVKGQSVVQQSPTKPAGYQAGPFTTQKAADAWLSNNITQNAGTLPSFLNPSSWLAGLGGDLASGIEAGFVAFFRDWWTVISGPLEVIAGLLVMGFVLVTYFKNDIASTALLAGMLA